MNTNDYLIHYGVKGMKWGVRHQPQRIGYSTSSTKLSEKQKKILKRVAIGAAITGGVLLATYGAVKVHDIHNYRKISKAAKDAVQEVLRKRNRQAIMDAKSEYSHPVYNNFDNKKDMIIDSYKDRVIKNREKAVKDEKELIDEGYKEFKKLRRAKIKDIVDPSPFGQSARLYDPYRVIDNYKKWTY